jgi:hypothetical protein
MSKQRSGGNGQGQRAYRDVLALATARLEKAEGELARNQRRCEELTAEIPQLRDLIAVTRKFLGMDKASHEIKAVSDQQANKPRRPSILDRVPDDIKKFLTTRPATVFPSNVESSGHISGVNGAAVEITSDEDSFLPSAGGDEVLP